MRVWRIARGRFPVLDGEGSRRIGGRWNSPRVPLVYTSGSRSLAVLEARVGIDPANVPADLRLFEIDVPDEAPLEVLDPRLLDADWQRPRSAGCQLLGDEWAASLRTLVLAVPSAVVPDERNYLINPRHPAITAARVVRSLPFEFDPRLLG